MALVGGVQTGDKGDTVFGEMGDGVEAGVCGLLRSSSLMGNRLKKTLNWSVEVKGRMATSCPAKACPTWKARP